MARAPLNVQNSVVVLCTFQCSTWLNELARRKVLHMLVTIDVSHISAWLKAWASANVRDIVVTLEVSHEKTWLKSTAPSKVLDSSVTRDVSQPSTFPLNARAFSKVDCTGQRQTLSPLRKGAVRYQVGLAWARHARGDAAEGKAIEATLLFDHVSERTVNVLTHDVFHPPRC